MNKFVKNEVLVDCFRTAFPRNGHKPFELYHEKYRAELCNDNEYRDIATKVYEDICLNSIDEYELEGILDYLSEDAYQLLIPEIIFGFLNGRYKNYGNLAETLHNAFDIKRTFGKGHYVNMFTNFVQALTLRQKDVLTLAFLTIYAEEDDINRFRCDSVSL